MWAIHSGVAEKMTTARFVAIAKALSDPMRLKVLEAIRGGEDVTCTCVCERVSLSQPTISHHVRALERAGVISIRKDGQFNRLSIRQDVLDEFAAAVTPRKRRRAP